MRSHRLAAVLVVALASGCASEQAPSQQTAHVTAVATPGELSWSDLGRLNTQPDGVPLFVSNNPEVVDGFGVLAGVACEGLALHGAQRAPGAHQAQWTREIVDERCPGGGLKELGVYLAHILPASLGQGRKLTRIVRTSALSRAIAKVSERPLNEAATRQRLH